MPNLTDTSTLRPETSTSRRERRRSSGIRKDIQGLRALAVGVVVLDHMIKWPTGGYVGVDVFFVISGFLITGLLLREHARSGTISFVDFYRRRLRRITPVAVLVLAVTVLTIFLIYGVGRTKTVLEEAVYSLLFAANWHFAVIGTDYMQANGPVSPLQHYWSLAVEEQFYIVWPVVILIVLGVSARRFRLSGMRALRVLRLVLVILTAGSFVYACWQSRAEPTWAYFSTLSRGWELGVGALVATLTSGWRCSHVRSGRFSRGPASLEFWVPWSSSIRTQFFPRPGAQSRSCPRPLSSPRRPGRTGLRLLASSLCGRCSTSVRFPILFIFGASR
jgi:peptidoglycan/LPS O-acetylase OafA/YrhL